MNSALAKIPRVDLGVRPTPLQEMTIAGRRLLVKRDDQTSETYGGNKPRSLEFLLAPTPRRALTFSTLSAHHAYATVVFAERLGIESDIVLVQRGRRGEVAAAVHARAARVIETRGVLSAIVAAGSLWRPGTRVLLPGGMTPRGALGYVAAAFEFEQIPPVVYVPVGSGTTLSGLLAGFMMRGATVELVGVRVADRIASWERLLWTRACRATALLRRQDPAVPRPDRGGVSLRIVGSAGAYGELTAESIDAVDAARRAGLVLETTYTGPTLAVALREDRDGACFLNTYAGPLG